jgi:hypothetical protein
VLRQVRVTLENKPGALARVVGILASTGSNIETLAVAPDPRQPGLSRMTLEAEFDPAQFLWLLGKINGLVNVLEAGEGPDYLLPPARAAAPALDPATGHGEIQPSNPPLCPSPFGPEV